ncbi:hypothetical protein [Metabacillus arenae]|uniref:IDEAL domain-containing protein n=1 Tax=Metabacillus arenae TaxID=2771434 RepID=A0A926NJ77_9BACI|nr:hypothetical protein [Metabacillus arenae]MBD1379107.1 hypothetical protein [Metabacillus arenae]
MNLSKTKAKYICEHNELGNKEYYKQVYLSDLQMWGAKRKITKSTFKKKEKEGFKVEYRKVIINFKIIEEMVLDIDSLIDLSLMTKDKAWFKQLISKRNLLNKILN